MSREARASLCMNLILVCRANVYRSPMAEAVLRARLRDTPAEKIRSAGLAPAAGLPRDERTQRVLAERGYPPVPSQFAQMLNEPMLHWADLVLVMEAQQRHALLRRFPAAAGKVWRLGHWLDCEIPDPHGSGLQPLRDTLLLIERCVDRWLSHPSFTSTKSDPPLS